MHEVVEESLLGKNACVTPSRNVHDTHRSLISLSKRIDKSKNKTEVGLWSKVPVFLCHKSSDKIFVVKCLSETFPAETLKKILVD